MSVDWNIDDIHLFEFPIIQIKFASISNANINDPAFLQLQKSIPIRLFLLSHHLANFGIPSIFMESIPSYLNANQIKPNNDRSDNIPSVTVFDIDNKFNDFYQSKKLPPWAETKQFIWSLKSTNPNSNNEKNIFFDLCEEFFDDLQQALTLKIHYQYYLLNPIYFTSYILIPPQLSIDNSRASNEINFKFSSIFEPILIKPVPSFVINCIRIRWIVHSNLSCVVNPRYTLKIGSFILFPPFRHPLCITSITKERTKIYKNSLEINDIKNTGMIPKQNSKVIPIPITKGTIKSLNPPKTINYSIEETIIYTAITIDKEETITFRIPPSNTENKMNIDFVLLANPSIALHYFFYIKNFQYEYKKLPAKYSFQRKQQIQQSSQQIQSPSQKSYPQFCHFQDLEIFNYTEKDIDNFFSQHFSEESLGQANLVTDQPEIVVSTIEDPVLTPTQLISEQITEKTAKKQISKTINSILLRFNPNITISEPFISPENDNQSLTSFTKRVNLELPKISFSNSRCLSSFNFLNFSEFFGFSNSVSPPISRMFKFTNAPTFHHLGIPSLLLSQEGSMKEVPADNFLSMWEREKYMPISGPKNCQYVVFYETFNDGRNGVNFPNNSSISDMLPTNVDELNIQALNEEAVKTFMKQISNTYSQLSFGEMKAFPKDTVYVPVKLRPSTKTSITTVTPSSSSSSSKKQLLPPQSKSETVTAKVETDVDYNLYECEAMKRAVFNFLSSEPLLQFQTFPVVAFIIGGPSSHFFTLETDRNTKNSGNVKDSDQCPHIHTVYVSPDIVLNGKEDQLRALSFEIYGRIRAYQQGPIGNVEFIMKQKLIAQKIQMQIQQLQSQTTQPNQNQEMQIQQMRKRLIYTEFFYKLFFGFRYQPPFVLRKNSDESVYVLNPNSNIMNGINLCIVWDRFAGVAVWTNDTGDLLHSIEAQSFNDILFMIQSLRSYPSQQHQQQQQVGLPLVRKITVTFLEEYLGKSYHEKFMQYMPTDVDLFTIFHAPSVKANFSETFNDDIAVFESPEVTNGITMIPMKNPQDPETVNLIYDLPAAPEASCYVLSRFHPTYKVSIYKGGGQERLLQFVKNMSHLSWLTVKPGHENRTSSYPPHLNALIQQNRTNCSQVSLFEFLPCE